MVKSPPRNASETEQAVNADTVELLECVQTARSFVSDFPGIVMESEQVTKDDEFGYIFRYKFKRPVQDRGETSYGSGSFILHSKDCKSFQIVTYSDFQLPDPTKEK